jgi:hypothetical protein
VVQISKFAPANWPPRPPSNSVYPGGLGDIVRDVTVDYGYEGEIPDEEEEEARMRND